MSLQITICAAKKLPHPTHQFGSISAQVSLVGEAGTLADAPAIMRDLFAAAQAGCDQHLAEQSGACQAPTSQAALYHGPTSSARSASPAQRPAASQPYRCGNTAQRRGPALVTESQLRFLDRLIAQTGTNVDGILQHHQVGALRDLSCKAAAGLIDELKALVPA